MFRRSNCHNNKRYIMKLLEWNEKLSVDNNVIDNQHKELFELTNQLIAEYNNDINSPLIGETLRDLLQYTKRHFKQEERLLKKVGYPKLKEHEKMHVDFVFKIAMFCKDVMECKPDIVEEMIEYLTDWLVNHTSEADLDFKNYLTKIA